MCTTGRRSKEKEKTKRRCWVLWWKCCEWCIDGDSNIAGGKKKGGLDPSGDTVKHTHTHTHTHTHKRQMPNKHPVEWTWRQLESTQWIAEDRSIVQFMFNSFQVAVGLMASQLMGCLMRTACINLYQHYIIAISPGSTLSSCVHVVRPTGLCCLVSKIARGTDFFLRNPSFAVYICTWASTC